MRRGTRGNHGTQLVDIRVQLVSSPLLAGVPTRPGRRWVRKIHNKGSIRDNTICYYCLTRRKLLALLSNTSIVSLPTFLDFWRGIMKIIFIEKGNSLEETDLREKERGRERDRERQRERERERK